MTAREKLLLALLALSLLSCAHGPRKLRVVHDGPVYSIAGAICFQPCTVRVTARSEVDACDTFQVAWGDGEGTFRTDYCSTTTRTWSALHVYRAAGEYEPVVLVAGKRAACLWGCVVTVRESLVGDAGHAQQDGKAYGFVPHGGQQ